MSEDTSVILEARRLMGTEVSVQIAAQERDVAGARAAAQEALAWLTEVDACLSRFQPESELCRLNAAAGTWFVASELLYSAVRKAIAGARASAGLFDPTLLRQLQALGYDRDFAAIADPAPRTAPTAVSGSDCSAAPAPAPGGRWRAIALDDARRRIRLPEGVALDLGGIAKGWAADVALDRFCAGYVGAILNVGGDLRVRGGPCPGQAWSVGIRDPREERPEDMGAVKLTCAQRAAITFSRGGLATSGAVRRWWWHHGTRQHHLLDPRTGRPMALWLAGAPADGKEHLTIATVTALAPTAARAEVATKVALLRGYPHALLAVERAWDRWGALGPDATSADVGVALVIILGDGRLVTSAHISAWLDTWGTAGAALPMLVAGAAAPPCAPPRPLAGRRQRISARA